MDGRDLYSALYVSISAIPASATMGRQFFPSFRNIYHSEKKSYYEWNQWKPMLSIGPWSFQLRDKVELRAEAEAGKTRKFNWKHRKSVAVMNRMS